MRWLVWFGVLALLACARPPSVAPVGTDSAESTPMTRTLTILYTNDEHGWLAGVEPGQGAAELAGLWRDREGCVTDADCLILSGGDLWTGPAISTWFQGESMTEILNALHYDAAAVGNHEFDFGLDVLAARAAQADFPLVSANIRYAGSERAPTELGIQPFAVIEDAGWRIGVIGLTTQATRTATHPANIQGLDFRDYAAALRQVAPQARAAGAQLLVAPGHLCRPEVEALAPVAAELGIALLGGGHCNELEAGVIDGVAVVTGGAHLASYAVVRLTLASDGRVLDVAAATRLNEGGLADPAVAAITTRWQATVDAELGVTIGYLAAPLPRRSQAMQDLVTYSWLWGVGSADFAVTNLGGLRADLPAGPVTLADILTVLPFDNVLVAVELTGDQVIRTFGGRFDAARAGFYFDGHNWINENDGLPLDRDAVYTVLVNDFMYAGGDEFGQLATLDPDAYNTAIDWRQPVIDWIKAQGSSAENPLDLAALRPRMGGAQHHTPPFSCSACKTSMAC